MSTRGNIYELAARCEHAWRARPPPDHPDLSNWARSFAPDIRALLGLLSECRQPMTVPPFVVALAHENNRAYVEGRAMDLEHLDPEMAPAGGLQIFEADRNYVLLPQEGWWTQYGEYSLQRFSFAAS